MTSILDPPVELVGPKGYIHGWICVRPPCGKPGGRVKHHEHGHGVIREAPDTDEPEIHFDNGVVGRVGKSKEQQEKTRWMATGVPGRTPHSELLEQRRQARKLLPPGHPERLRAENNVRLSRKLSAGKLKPREGTGWGYRPESEGGGYGEMSVPYRFQKRSFGGFEVVRHDNGRSLGWVTQRSQREEHPGMWEAHISSMAFRGSGPNDLGDALDEVPQSLDYRGAALRELSRTREGAVDVIMSHLMREHAPAVGYGKHYSVREYPTLERREAADAKYWKDRVSRLPALPGSEEVIAEAKKWAASITPEDQMPGRYWARVHEAAQDYLLYGIGPLYRILGDRGTETEGEPDIGGVSHKELLRQRALMRRKYPAGHPERLRAERAVRQSRKQMRIQQAPLTPTQREAVTEKGEAARYARLLRHVATPINKGGHGLNIHGVAQSAPQLASLERRHDYLHRSSGIVHEHARTKDRFRPANAVINFSGHTPEDDFQINNEVAKFYQRQHELIPEITNGTVVYVVDQEGLQRGGTPTGTLGRVLGRGGGNLYRGAYSGSMRVAPEIFTIGRLHSTGETPREVIDRNVHTGWWPPVDDTASLADMLMSHEIGHGVAHYLAGIKSNPREPELWDGIAKAIGVSPPAQTHGAFHTDAELNAWVKASRVTLMKRVSLYGKSNPQELLAELWAEFSLSSNPRAAAKFYGEYVQKVMAQRKRRSAA